MGTEDGTKPNQPTTINASSGGNAKREDPEKKPTTQASGTRQRRRIRRSKGQSSNDGGSVLKTKFTGACPDLKGSIYHIGSNQADLYIRSTKTIAIYVGKNYTTEARHAIEKLTWPTFKEPAMPAKLVTVGDKTELQIEKRQLNIKLKKHIDEEEQFDKDMHQIYALIEGQCTNAMIQKTKADDTYEVAQRDADPVKSLEIIKKICYSCLTEQSPVLSLAKSLKRLMVLK